MKDKENRKYKYNKLEEAELEGDETVIFAKSEAKEKHMKGTTSSNPHRNTREDQVPLMEAEDQCPS